MNPEGLYNYLSEYKIDGKNLDVKPLKKGANSGIPFNEGGGYNVLFESPYGQSYIQYNPSSSHHNFVPYYKVSSGNVFDYTGETTGTQRFKLDGSVIMANENG